MLANDSLSTANALPAGTALTSAHSISNDPNFRISSFRTPDALSNKFEPNELEQTSSAKKAPVWAPVGVFGRISYNLTLAPLFAACHAASVPAKPPPTTVNTFDIKKTLTLSVQ